MHKYIYQIKDLDTGLYLQRGYRWHWSKGGTIWKRKSDLSASLNGGKLPEFLLKFPNTRIFMYIPMPTSSKTISEWRNSDG